jgi:hypothetical protein
MIIFEAQSASRHFGLFLLAINLVRVKGRFVNKFELFVSLFFLLVTNRLC